MERPIACSGCFTHIEPETCGVILYMVTYGPGHRSGRPQPLPCPFPDGRTAKFACEDCWETWEVFATDVGHDEPPGCAQDLAGVASLSKCSVCDTDAIYDLNGAIVFPVIYYPGQRSGQLIPFPDHWADGTAAKLICIDCWQCWEVLEDNTGYTMPDPSVLLEVA